MTPRTTVTMPAYNAEATLREAVESVLAQTVGDFEIVVVDDGSRIPVEEVLSDIGDERLRIVRHQVNRGLGATRNTALATARAPLISQLDADDWWEPEYLEQVLPRFSDPRIGLVYTDATIVRADGSVEPYLMSHLEHPIDTFPRLAELNPIAALTVTARTEAVRGVGGYAAWIWGAQDYHLYLKLAAAGWRFGYVDRPLARYRWPEDTGGMSSDERKVMVTNLKMFAGFKLRHPFVPGPGKRLAAIALEVAKRWTPGVSPAARALKRRLR